MKLALVLGSKSATIKPKLQSIKDNLDIDCFDNIPMFIDFALKRSTIYDRILCLSSNSDENMIKDLHSYWSYYSRGTSVVFLCKKNADEEIARKFVTMFTSPLVSSMLVENTTVQVLSEAVLCSNAEINEQYGIKDFIGVDADEGVEFNLPVKEESQPIEQPVVQSTEESVVQDVSQQDVQPQTQEPKQKRSLIGSLFGGGKKNKNQGQQPNLNDTSQQIPQSQQMEQQAPQQMQQVPQQMNQPQQMPNQQQVQQNQMVDNNQQSQNMQNITQNMNNSVSEMKGELSGLAQRKRKNGRKTVEEQPTQSQDFLDNVNTEQYQEEPAFEESSQLDNTSDFSMETSDFETSNNSFEEQNLNFESNDSFESEEVLNESVEEPINNETHFTNFENRYARKDSTSEQNSNINSGFSSPLESPEVNMTSTLNTNVRDDFAPDNIAPESSFISHRGMSVEQDEVDEDLGSVNLSTAEDTYRKQNEQPKVVVKEVIRTVGGGDGTIKSILSGKNPTVIVVTGDRGTGVTSAAMKLSEFFASKTRVLYFDCDVENHGVLSYINYDGFRDYEPTKMNGVKLCKSIKVFDNCVCNFESNFDILTTDYTCDATDDEIATAASVVAEKVTDYGVVIVDCPVKKLHAIYDLVLQGITIMCVEGTKRGMMNMLCQFENSPLQLKYKKMIVNKGCMFITKLSNKTDFKKLLKYVGSVYEPDGVNWLSMRNMPFNGNIDMKMMSAVIVK